MALGILTLTVLVVIPVALVATALHVIGRILLKN